MPIVTLTPGVWKPDAGDIEHDGLWRVNDAIPFAGRWAPLPTSTKENLATATFANKLTALYLHNESTTTADETLETGWRIFAADTNGQVWRGTGVNDLTLTTAGALVAASFFTHYGIQFTSYGN